MKVRDLLEILNQADPESIVLYMTQYADTDESDEVREVDIPTELWTYERGRYGAVNTRRTIPALPNRAQTATAMSSTKASALSCYPMGRRTCDLNHDDAEI
jgi:hypothetical protein